MASTIAKPYKLYKNHNVILKENETKEQYIGNWIKIEYHSNRHHKYAHYHILDNGKIEEYECRCIGSEGYEEFIYTKSNKPYSYFPKDTVEYYINKFYNKTKEEAKEETKQKPKNTTKNLLEGAVCLWKSKFNTAMEQYSNNQITIKELKDIAAKYGEATKKLEEYNKVNQHKNSDFVAIEDDDIEF